MQLEYGNGLNAYGGNIMRNSVPHYDVVIVGASVGGSAAAILFAQQGLRVALIERNIQKSVYPLHPAKRAADHSTYGPG